MSSVLKPLCGSLKEANCDFYFSIFLFCKESRLLWYLKWGAPEQEYPQKQVSVLSISVLCSSVWHRQECQYTRFIKALGLFSSVSSTQICLLLHLHNHSNRNNISYWSGLIVFIHVFCGVKSVLIWTQKNCWKVTFCFSLEQNIQPLNSYFYCSFFHVLSLSTLKCCSVLTLFKDSYRHVLL